MRIAIVGGGAREVALARSLKKSSKCTAIIAIATHKNPALQEYCVSYSVGNTEDNTSVVNFCKNEKADLVVVGPEAPLANGVVDALEAVGIKCFGPTKFFAQVESSKQFARELMQKYKIPGCPKFKNFATTEGMAEFIESLNDDYVVKADGLMAGKGVKISGAHLATPADAIAFAQTLVDKGQRVVVEEKLEGEEFTLMSFCDGRTLVHLPPVQDYKRAYPDDKGPITGGMGSYSCGNFLLPFLTPNDVEAAKGVQERLAAALLAEAPQGSGGFKGILYGKYACRRRGVAALDFNARFGDPEALNVLAILRSDLVTILDAVVNGTLRRDMVELKAVSTVVKFAAPYGYPDKPLVGQTVEVEHAKSSNVFLASVNLVPGPEPQLLSTGSRTVAVIGVGPTLEIAERECEGEVRKVKGLFFHRADIATPPSVAAKVARQTELRRVRLGVVGSTRGSSLQPILNAIQDGMLNARVEVVVSNIESAPILERARVHGIPWVHIPGKGRVREDFDRDVTNALRAKKVDLVLLIGFMRIVSDQFCRDWAGRLLNVHPSLLPKHGGLMDLAVHQAVIDAHDLETGCTVHQVVEEVDGGATVLQLKVPVHLDDTAKTLKAKVQELEAKALIAAVELFDELDGRLPA